MNEALSVLRWALVLLFLGAGAVRAEEALKSGLQPGESLPSSFEPFNVTGEHAGKGQLSDEEIGRILADLPRIVPAK